MIRCVYDSETTGKWNKWQTFDHPEQPRIITMGSCLFAADFSELACAYSIVRPEWDKSKLQAEAFSKHGISYEQAMAEGIAWEEAWEQQECLMRQADQVLIFNETFDRNLVDIETLLRYGRMSYLNSRRSHIVDIMKLSIDILKLPGQFGTYKWPKLEELYEWLYGEPLVGGHNCSTDARAVGWCAYKMLELKLWNGKDLS